MKKITLFFILFALSFVAKAQDLNPIKWTYETLQEGVITKIIFTAAIDDGWYLYAQDIPEGGPIPTSFHFETDNSVLFEPFAEESSDFLIESYDEMFGMELKKYKNQVVFTYTPEVMDAIETIKGHLEYMCCDGTQCLAPKIIEFNLKLK